MAAASQTCGSPLTASPCRLRLLGRRRGPMSLGHLQIGAGPRRGWDAVVEADLAVANDVAIAARFLHSPPVSARLIMPDLVAVTLQIEILWTIDQHVIGHSLEKRPAILDPHHAGRLVGEAIVHFLQRLETVLPREPDQQVSRPAAATGDLAVRAGV